MIFLQLSFPLSKERKRRATYRQAQDLVFFVLLRDRNYWSYIVVVRHKNKPEFFEQIVQSHNPLKGTGPHFQLNLSLKWRGYVKQAYDFIGFNIWSVAKSSNIDSTGEPNSADLVSHSICLERRGIP